MIPMDVMTSGCIDDSKVVLMCGVSGSGKTLLSLKLEGKGFVRLSTDELLWDRYGPGFCSLPSDRQKELFIEASHEIVATTVRLVAAGKKVVVDSTMCKRFKRDEMREACLPLGVDPLIVYLDTPYPLLLKRLALRKGCGPNDLPVTKRQLDSFCSNFEIPQDDENVIVVSQPDDIT